jgi:hypothetical protein
MAVESFRHKNRRPYHINKTALYFGLLLITTLAAYTAIVLIPAAFTFVSAVFAAAAALTISGIAPLAFLSGLSVLATALVAAAIVFAAGAALYMTAKLCVMTATWLGHKLNRLATTLFDKFNDKLAKKGPENQNDEPELTLEDPSVLETKDGFISTNDLLTVFKGAVTDDTKVRGRTEHNKIKKLNKEKIVLQNGRGDVMDKDEDIAIQADLSTLDTKTPAEIIEIANKSGFYFFRRFNSADKVNVAVNLVN